MHSLTRFDTSLVSVLVDDSYTESSVYKHTYVKCYSAHIHKTDLLCITEVQIRMIN